MQKGRSTSKSVSGQFLVKGRRRCLLRSLQSIIPLLSPFTDRPATQERVTKLLCVRAQIINFTMLTFFPTVYLLIAYDYFSEDPMICLTLAIASMGRAMQRQSDNRNYLVSQVSSTVTYSRPLTFYNSGNGVYDEV